MAESVQLTPGSPLGTYEILDFIGAGGMGEVYRAKDTKLGREVAIKVLPESFSQSKERLSRFEREAQLLASLNHPNIAAIYGLEVGSHQPERSAERSGVAEREVVGVGPHDTDQRPPIHFLVLELVSGETLADRLERGALPVEEALQIARKLALALEAAHDQGIIHRDLKPANLKVRDDGEVKVLDFGLAKALADEPSKPDLSQSPTLSARATAAGVILGTAPYMSPEQARGKSVDKRTDVFSFGIVLFEMLTGTRLFHGEEVSDVLAAVLKTEPDWDSLPSDLDPRIRKLLKRCLEKDPKKRRRDIGEARLEIENVLAGPHEENDTVAPAPGRRRSLTLAFVAAVTLSAVAAVLAWNLKPSTPPPLTRFAIPLGEKETFSYSGRHLVAVSPSGTHLVYSANRQLYLRAMDQTEPTEMRGTEQGRSPFFSPDGQWVGFWAEGKLRKVAITGGAPVTLCEASNPYGVSWSKDGTIVYGQGPAGIWRVSGNGGDPERLAEVKEGESASSPQVLPDRKHLLFTLGDGAKWGEARIVAQSLESGERKILFQGGADARYVPTGHLMYAVESTLMAVAFDLGRLEVRGSPVPVVDPVAHSDAGTGAAHVSISDTGTLAFISDRGSTRGSLVRVNRGGNAEPVTERLGEFSQPRLSPGGDRLAVTITDRGGSDIWVLDIARDTLTRLTTEGVNIAPLWSPDGSWIIFTSNLDVYRKRSDFSGSAEHLLQRENEQYPAAVSADGKWLVFVDYSSGGSQSDLWTLPLDGGEPRALTETPFFENVPTLSPDGRWIAYESSESGRYEIYVQPFPEGGARYSVSTEGGRDPVWSADGREIFYENGAAILSVSVSAGPHFGAPELLFEGPHIYAYGRNFDVSSDGKHFVMVYPPDKSGPERDQINVVLGWFQELERLVPSK